jgi:hypothetical protein
MRFLIVLLVSAPLVAQDDIDVKRAMGYTVGEVLGSSRYQRELELVPEQIEKIKKLREAFLPYYKSLLNESLGLRPDSPAGDPEVFPNLQSRQQTPEWVAKLKEQERILEDQLKAELLPHQLEIAEGIVLQERYKVGGLRAVVGSVDLDTIAKLKLQRGVELRNRLDKAENKIEEESAELRAELEVILAEYRKKFAEIRKRQIEAALDEMGEDGAKIKILTATIDTPQIEMGVKPAQIPNVPR